MRTAKPKGEIGSSMTDFVWLCWFAVSPETNILLEQPCHSQQDKVQTTRAGTRGPSLSSPNSPFSSLLGSCSQPHSQPENSMQFPGFSMFVPASMPWYMLFLLPMACQQTSHLDDTSPIFKHVRFPLRFPRLL